MAAPIPTSEPGRITAGDTAKWTRSFADYSAADGWTLSYALSLEGDGQQVTFTGTASGASHLISVAAADTALWEPGSYIAQGYVTKTTERYKVFEGFVVVLPNLALPGQPDQRSQAKRIYDALCDMSEKWAAKQTSAAVIEGVQFTFKSFDDLRKALNFWGSKVARERGQGRRVILSRMRAPDMFPPTYPTLP